MNFLYSFKVANGEYDIVLFLNTKSITATDKTKASLTICMDIYYLAQGWLLGKRYSQLSVHIINFTLSLYLVKFDLCEALPIPIYNILFKKLGLQFICVPFTIFISPNVLGKSLSRCEYS